jgi:hypothetical protein
VEGSAGASALVPPPGQAGACRIRVCVRALTGRGARKPRESRIKARRLFLTEPHEDPSRGPAPGPRRIDTWFMPVPARPDPGAVGSCNVERAQAASSNVVRYTIGVYDRRKDYYKWRTRAASRRAPAPLARGRSVRSRAHRSRAVLERVIYRKATETRTDSLRSGGVLARG